MKNLPSHLSPSGDLSIPTSTPTTRQQFPVNNWSGIPQFLKGNIMSLSKPSIKSSFDLNELRLPATYCATLSVKKLLTNVAVGKPRKPQFFRTHKSEDMTFAAMLLEQKEDRENYLVMPDVAQKISEVVRPVVLHAAIDRQSNVFLIPVLLPGESGLRNPWAESLAQAVEHAKLKWIRIAANMRAGCYDIYQAEGTLPEPEWTEHDIEALGVWAAETP